MLRWLWLSSVVIGLDQLTKFFADTLLDPYQALPVTPFFNLTLMYNKGAAFSFLSEAGGWQRWFFIVLALGVTGVLIAWLRGVSPGQRRAALALSLIIGGAVGNLIDRVFRGQVVDFIQLYYQQWYWPAFNVADSAITVGVVIMLLDAVFTKHEENQKNGQD
jgi:signal peptidase II